MLPKINRLTKKKDFELVFKKGIVFKNDFLLFKTIKNHLKESRFGFVVSKKISNKANIRNKVKRRLRQAVLNKLKEFKKSEVGSSLYEGNSRDPVDVVIIALSGIEGKEFPQIQEMIIKFLRK